MAIGSIIGGIASGIVGGILGKKGAENAAEQNYETQLALAREAKKLPDWLAPYYTGAVTQPAPQPTPINVNWLQAMNNIANTGYPQTHVPPMSMNNPMLTGQNVYVPTEGGMFGYGVGPGTPVTDNPNWWNQSATGPIYARQQAGHQPGVTDNRGAATGTGGTQEGTETQKKTLPDDYQKTSVRRGGKPCYRKGNKLVCTDKYS